MAEPTAWATLALALAGRNDAAGGGAQWLADRQDNKGMVPATSEGDAPGWPTSLAMLAWQQVDPQQYAAAIQQGLEWLVRTEGTTNPKSEHVGHDTMLVGWSWAANTHSWLEPTAFATMALTATGHGQHPRNQQAVQLVVDRLLPAGGANYGNTMVLGNQLLPHLQPSSIALWALAWQQVDDPRIEKSLAYIEHELHNRTGCASLAYALLALTAWNRRPANSQALLDEALSRPGVQESCYKLALLSLAMHDEPLPLTPPQSPN